MQQDELCPYLSVIEAMELAANLKLGNELSYHAKHLLVIRWQPISTNFPSIIFDFIRLTKSLKQSALTTQEKL